MKRLKFLVVVCLIVFLSTCSSNISPIATTTSQPTEIQTQIPTTTPAPTPTSTLAPTPTITPSPTPFTSISNQLIAFQEKLFGQIFVSDLSGHEPINITKEPKGYKDLIGWSPDGKWIVFEKTNYNPFGTISNPRTTEIWISNPDGSEKYNLGHGQESQVFWAPDSSYVISADFSKSNSEPDAYYIYYVNNFEKIVLNEGKLIFSSSPNGFLYIYSQDASQMFSVKRLGEAPIKKFSYAELYTPVIKPCEIDSISYIATTGVWTWFPDSSRFLQMIFCGIPSHPSDKRVILETTIGTEITSVAFEWPNNRGLINISPNGKWMLSSEYDIKKGVTCVVLDINFKPVSSFNCTYPKWSPDGNQIIDSVKYKGGKFSVVYIDPQSGQTTLAESLQWLNNFKDTTEQGLWEIQPH